MSSKHDRAGRHVGGISGLGFLWQATMARVVAEGRKGDKLAKCVSDKKLHDLDYHTECHRKSEVDSD